MKRKQLFFTLLFLICIMSAAFAQQVRKPDVGDIAFDPNLDDTAFHVCGDYAFQYYNSASYYKNHKDSISAFILQQYHPPVNGANQSGYVTVRFIINCQGQTGRFRVFEMDSSYQPFVFDKVISSQLLNLVKSVKSWRAAAYKGSFYDSYQYICFRIRNSKIISISP